MPQHSTGRIRNNYPQWIKLQIESLSPGQHFVIPPHIASTINETNFRTMISANNRHYNLNLKVHRDTSTIPNQIQLWVWYCPIPKQPKSPNPKPTLLHERIQSLNQSLQDSLSRDDMATAMAINSELEQLKITLSEPKPKLTYRRKNSITFPLDAILSTLNLTKSEWDAMDPSLRLKLRIKTELELKFNYSQHSS